MSDRTRANQLNSNLLNPYSILLNGAAQAFGIIFSTMVIDNLETNVLVKRKRYNRCNIDRRYFIVHLTSWGKKLIDNISLQHAAVIADEMSVLSESEQETLSKLCKKLGSNNKT